MAAPSQFLDQNEADSTTGLQKHYDLKYGLIPANCNNMYIVIALKSLANSLAVVETYIILLTQLAICILNYHQMGWLLFEVWLQTKHMNYVIYVTVV